MSFLKNGLGQAGNNYLFRKRGYTVICVAQFSNHTFQFSSAEYGWEMMKDYLHEGIKYVNG